MFTVFNAVHAMLENESHINELDTLKYRFSKTYFCTVLSKTVQSWERPQLNNGSDDTSKAIIWNAWPSRMFQRSNANSSTIAAPKPLIVDIAENQIPLLANNSIDAENFHCFNPFPFESLTCKKAKSFLSDYLKGKNSIRILRILSLRYVLMSQRCIESWTIFRNYKVIFKTFKIRGDLYLHHFFLSMEIMHAFFKNLNRNFKYLWTDDDPTTNANHQKIADAARINETNWNTETINGSPDYSCLFDYSGIPNAVSTATEIRASLSKVTTPNDLIPPSVLSTDGVLLPELFETAHSLLNGLCKKSSDENSDT